MKRREFLFRVGAVVIAIPATHALFGCGGEGDGGGDGSGTPSPTGGQDLVVTSSVVDGHSHTVTISAAELSNPPADGTTEDTSEAQGHTHRVTLSSADLTAVNNGQEVMRSTTLEDGHIHTFTFRRSGGSTGGTNGGPGGY